MTREAVPLRGLLITGVCLPLALVIGYLLATLEGWTSYSLVGLILCVLAFPLFIRWHQPLLMLTWNASIIVFFVPGQPSLGVLVALGCLFLAIVNRTLRNQSSYISHRPVSYPLILLMLVVLFTAAATGGIGGRVFGSENWGARRYFGVLGAVVGYYALVAQPIPPEKARRYALWFILAGATTIVSDLIFAAGPAFYPLFAVFPSGIASLQASSYFSYGGVSRFAGLATASQAVCGFLLLRYGVRGVFNWRHPWRLSLFVVILMFGMFGGYRTTVIMFSILFAIQFYLERLYRTALLPALLLTALLAGGILVSFSDRLPLPMQRSLSFLPIEIDPVVRQDALGTVDWRLQMWKVVLPDVPKYLLIGKGYSFSGTDYRLTQMAMERGLFQSYEDTLISGNYHNGILTLIIPVGLFGALAFLLFCGTSWRALYANYRYGDPGLKGINTFLLAYFLTRLTVYLTLYGQFDLDLVIFTGTVGLSIALNGGVRRKDEPAHQPATETGKTAESPAA
jgi:hypothetical protein